MAELRNDTGVVVCHGRMKSELLWLKPTISAMVFVGSCESGGWDPELVREK